MIQGKYPKRFIGTPSKISEENGNTNSKKYMHSNVHSRIIYDSQDMEAA